MEFVQLPPQVCAGLPAQGMLQVPAVVYWLMSEPP